MPGAQQGRGKRVNNQETKGTKEGRNIRLQPTVDFVQLRSLGTSPPSATLPTGKSEETDRTVQLSVR
jgi:hypothetical protein